MADLSKTYLYRMTHIENIPHILRYGITHSSSHNANPDFIPIGDSTLISTRNDFLLNNGRTLGEYIPFYFGRRTPMLYVMQKGYNMVRPTPAEDIVYCVTSVQKIIEQGLDFVFTDGHAVDKFTGQYAIDDINNIDNIVNRQDVNAMDWKKDTDLDLKRRKQAEFLVCGDIAIDGILGFLVYNENAKTRILNYGANAANVLVKPIHYFLS